MTETFDTGKIADELRALVSEAEALLRSTVERRQRRTGGARAATRCRI